MPRDERQSMRRDVCHVLVSGANVHTPHGLWQQRKIGVASDSGGLI